MSNVVETVESEKITPSVVKMEESFSLVFWSVSENLIAVDGGDLRSELWFSHSESDFMPATRVAKIPTPVAHLTVTETVQSGGDSVVTENGGQDIITLACRGDTLGEKPEDKPSTCGDKRPDEPDCGINRLTCPGDTLGEKREDKPSTCVDKRPDEPDCGIEGDDTGSTCSEVEHVCSLTRLYAFRRLVRGGDLRYGPRKRVDQPDWSEILSARIEDPEDRPSGCCSGRRNILSKAKSRIGEFCQRTWCRIRGKKRKQRRRSVEESRLTEAEGGVHC